MGNDSIDIGLKNIWQSFYAFKKGKRRTHALDLFEYYLEQNLYVLQHQLQTGVYHHGSYRTFTVQENKKRTVAVASIPDRIVHRLLYDYLVPIFDKTFNYDVWSCRKGKGLQGAIQRAKQFISQHPHGYVWRADVQKFFESVDQYTLFMLIQRRVNDPITLKLIQTVLQSYPQIAQRERERELLPGFKQVCRLVI
jgi:retron-type reverse transcriptase